MGKDLDAYDATYITPYVDHAVSKGLYVIIDMHLVRNYGDAAGAVPQSGWGLPLREYLDARSQIGWLGWIFGNFWQR